MTMSFLAHVALPVLLGLSITFWGAAVLGFASDARDNERTSSLLVLAAKYCPPWWRRFTKWFFAIWTGLLLLTFILNVFIRNLK